MIFNPRDFGAVPAGFGIEALRPVETAPGRAKRFLTPFRVTFTLDQVTGDWLPEE